MRNKRTIPLTLALVFWVAILLINACSYFNRADEERTAIESSMAYYAKKANMLADSGRFALALNHYRAAIELNANDPILHHNIGVCFIQLNEFDSAIVHLQTAILLQPAYIQAQLSLAKAYWSIGDNNQAIAVCRKAVMQDPVNGEAFFLLGQLYEELDLLDQAEDAFKRAVTLRPNDFDARNNLGAVYYRKGQLGKAIGVFEELLDLNPNYLNAYLNMGHALVRRCMFGPALDVYQKAVNLAPKNPKPLNMIGICLAMMRQDAEALGYFRRVVQLEPDSAYVYYNLSVVLAHMDSLAAAQSANAQAIALDSTNAQYYYQYGNLMIVDRNFDQAVQAFARSTRYDSLFAPAHQNLGSAFLELNKIPAAIAAYRAAARQYPILLERRFQLRRSVAEQGTLNLEAVCGDENELKEQYAITLNDLGKAYLRANQRDSARYTYEKAIAIFPGSIEVFYNLGSLLLQQGKTVEANQNFARAHLNRGIRLMAMDSLRAAQEEFGIASRRWPNWPEPLIQQALIAMKSGTQADAKDLLTRALFLAPNSAQAHLAMAKYHALNDALDKAVESCETALKLAPQDLELHSFYVTLLRGKGAANLRAAEHQYGFLQGQAYESDGFLDRAMEEYHRIIDQDSVNVSARVALGLVLLRVGMSGDAEQHFRSALAIDSTAARAHYGLGLYLGEKQQYHQAIAELKTAVALDPGMGEAFYALAVNYFFLNQFESADQAVQQAQRVGHTVNENFLRELHKALQR